MTLPWLAEAEAVEAEARLRPAPELEEVLADVLALYEEDADALLSELDEADWAAVVELAGGLDDVLAEAAGSLAKASVHEPIIGSKGKGLWGQKGWQLPAYIQHIANDIIESGKSRPHAIAIAIATVKRWAAGAGKNISATTKAAAAKALAEWEALKAKIHAKTGAKRAGRVSEAAEPGLPWLDPAGRARPTRPGTGPALEEQARYFDEKLHPRDPAGHFAEKLSNLRVGGRLETTTGVVVHKQAAGSYAVRVPGGRESLHDKPLDAARTALDHNRERKKKERLIPQGEPSFIHLAQRLGYGTTYRAVHEEDADGLPWLRERMVPQLSSFSLSQLAGRRHRDPRGRFEDELSKLSSGGSFRIGNVEVQHHGRASAHSPERFSVRTRLGPSSVAREHALGRAQATKLALRHSLGDPHPDAVGGNRKIDLPDVFPGGGAFSHKDLEQKGPDLIRNAHGAERWDSYRANADKMIGGALDHEGEGSGSSKTLHVRNGQYTPERAALHRDIVRLFLQGNHQGRENPEALLLAGGPASGKSTALRTGVVSKPDSSVLINPDAIRNMIPEYRELIKRGDPAASSHVHAEASDIAKLLHKNALERRMNVTIDKVKIKPREVQDMREQHGYQFRPSLVATTPIFLAKARAKKRAEGEGPDAGRFVSDRVLMAGHQEVARSFESWARQTGLDLHLHDTATGKTVATASGGVIKVKNRRGYEKALRRGGIGR